VVLAMVLLVATGCGTRNGSAAPGTLWQRTFLSTAVTGGGQPRELVPGTRIRLVFGAGHLRADAGCNQLTWQAGVNGDRLVLSGPAATEMGCTPDRLAQDTWLSTFLSAGPAWELDGDNLTLRTGGSEIRLVDRRVADPDRPLEGTRWLVRSIVDGQQTASLPTGVQAELTLGRNGHVTGSTGCDTLSGTASRHGDTITFSTVTTSGKPCTGDAGGVQTAMLAVLDGDATVHIDGAQLTLLDDAGRGIHLQAAD
jgi:heat shock protein HslJ